MRCLTHTGLTGLPCGVESPAPEASASPGRGSRSERRSLRAGARRGRRRRRKAFPGRVPFGGAIREPRKVKNVNPAYPDIARQARVQGVVILECTIGRDGRIEHVKILRGIPLLEAAAVEAVNQWVYDPTLVNGVPARVIMTVTVHFQAVLSLGRLHRGRPSRRTIGQPSRSGQEEIASVSGGPAGGNASAPRPPRRTRRPARHRRFP